CEIKIFKKENNNCMATVSGHDPFGKDSLSDENFKKIQTTIFKRLQEINSNHENSCRHIKSSYGIRQKGGSVDCGPISCNDLIKRVKGISLDVNNPYPLGAEELRKNQLDTRKYLFSSEKNVVNIHVATSIKSTNSFAKRSEKNNLPMSVQNAN